MHRRKGCRVNRCYEDILSRIDESPKWFDEQGVPRFEKFSPDQCADIYAQEVVFFEIECQNCRRKFDVCESWSSLACDRENSLGKSIPLYGLHYGDPPNIECCPAGPTMSSMTIKIHEFWRRANHGPMEWVRVPEIEAIDVADKYDDA